MVKQNEKKSNAGRKPVTDKKMPVTLYVYQSVIDMVGLIAIKEVANKAIQSKYSEVNRTTD